MAASGGRRRRGWLAFVVAAMVAVAAVQPGRAVAEEAIYGRGLMTRQEQEAYRDRLRRAGSDEERARIRAEHQTQMQNRIRLQDRTQPDGPPATGRGPGGGLGGGPGGGPGGGMAGPRGGGPGGGRGR